MKKMKLLIATTNAGKFNEFLNFLGDLPFKFVNLKNLGLNTQEMEEPFLTCEKNAIHKARFYAKKSGLMTLAEDTGLFIDHLKGKPGAHVKRSASTAQKRLEKIINALHGVPWKKRKAFFQTSICLYNPKTQDFQIFTGKVNGIIATKIIGGARKGMEHDSIFYYPPFKKAFAELSLPEKNSVSHRGKALGKVKYFLQNQYRPKQAKAEVKSQDNSHP